ncbi:MAG: glycosyltransferase family 4 protein [Ktedonobacterales bacterium]|nr:glycosyltransferase family 4 protein [Ktedonobacterales bacterium]
MSAPRSALQKSTPCRALLVIAAQPDAEREAAVAADHRPRTDYTLLGAALGADLLSPAGARARGIGRLLAPISMPLALAWAAFTRRRRYEVIYSDSERIGLPLTVLLWLARARRGHPRHVMLAHHLSPAKKRIWFHLGAARYVDTLIVHASTQQTLAVEALRMPAERVALLPYQVDTRFWRPLPEVAAAARPPSICAAGLEFRDYATLIAAARDLDIHVHIAAASQWSHHRAFAGAVTLPANVSVAGYDHAGLRQLYATARFVVVPLLDSDNQAGITTILEAMAMGKAVVVSATRGQTDVVRGYPFGDRPVWRPCLVDTLGGDATLAELPTGIYVTPSDAEELRRALRFLLEHPEVAAELGRNGRQVVRASFGVEAFAQRFAAIIQGRSSRDDHPGTLIRGESQLDQRSEH